MKTLIERLRNEPVLLTTLVQAVLTLVVAFGLNLSTAQNIAILGVTTAGLAIFARSKVAPVAALEELAAAEEDRLDGHVPQI